MEAKIIVRDCKSKDGKKSFKSYKLVDEANNGKLIDCVMCKTIAPEAINALNANHKSKVVGDISINHNYEYPKAFIRSLDFVEKA